jgi:hypothetical protein
MAAAFNLSIPCMMAFKGALITVLFIIHTDEHVNSRRSIILNKDKQADVTIDKGKRYY